MIKFQVDYVYEKSWAGLITCYPLAEPETFEINSKKEFRKLLPHFRSRKKELVNCTADFGFMTKVNCNKYIFTIIEPKPMEITAVSWFEEVLDKLLSK